MPRSESPITWDGPAADLARELRRLRDEAGKPTYRTMARTIRFSSTVLCDAAAGRTRPSQEVARAFARACGADADTLAAVDALWDAANKAHQATRSRENRARLQVRDRRRILRRLDPPQESRESQERPHSPSRPRPDPLGTAAEFVLQLRKLRAWAGQPGHKKIGSNRWDHRQSPRLPRSTMYDALNKNRKTLPSLHAVRHIVTACAPTSADAWIVDEWTEAWRAIKLREVTPVEEPPAEPPAAQAS
jgi:hypothetical protein